MEALLVIGQAILRLSRLYVDISRKTDNRELVGQQGSRVSYSIIGDIEKVAIEALRASEIEDPVAPRHMLRTGQCFLPEYLTLPRRERAQGAADAM